MRPDVRAALNEHLRRVRSVRLSDWMAHQHASQYQPRRIRSALIPTDGDYAMTADHIIDDPREPIITPIGVLDSRGKMLLRVQVPIKIPLGFGRRQSEPVDEHVEAIVAEDMLAISDIGMGISHVTPEEADGDASDELRALIEELVREAAGDLDRLAELLAPHGLGISGEGPATCVVRLDADGAR